MAITKNTYQTNHAINPYYVRIVEDSNRTDFVIIDDWTTGGFAGNLNVQASGATIWIKIEANCQVTVLASAPSSVTAFTPAHSEWSLTRIYIVSGETFVVHYSGTPMDDATNRDAVTGYQMNASDVLYIKIDHSADTVTAYQ